MMVCAGFAVSPLAQVLTMIMLAALVVTRAVNVSAAGCALDATPVLRSWNAPLGA
jgi:hypothetical protein